MTLLKFGFLFGGGMAVPGGGHDREFFVPGVFALMMVFALEATCATVASAAVASAAAKGSPTASAQS